MMSRNDNVIGVVPAAGFATRVSSLLSRSKEVYSIKHPELESRVVSSYLIEGFRKAGATRAYLIIRSGKWDIPEHYKDGTTIGLNLAHIVVEGTKGVPQTIDKAYPFIKENKVLLGFPDIIFCPSSAFDSLLNKQENTGADLVLGLFKATNPVKSDMVVLNDAGELEDIVIKPEETSLIYTWIIAAWTPVFSTFLHDYLKKKSETTKVNGELQVGDVVQGAINSGLKTNYVKFDDGVFLDIGTPEDLEKARSINWLKNET